MSYEVLSGKIDLTYLMSYEVLSRGINEDDEICAVRNHLCQNYEFFMNVHEFLIY